MTFPTDHKSQMPVYCPLDTTIVIDQRGATGDGVRLDRRKCPRFHNEAVCPLYIGTRIGGQCTFTAIASHLDRHQEALWDWGMIGRLIRGLADAAIGVVKVAKGPISMKEGGSIARSQLKSHDGIALDRNQEVRMCDCGYLLITEKGLGSVECSECGVTVVGPTNYDADGKPIEEAKK